MKKNTRKIRRTKVGRPKHLSVAIVMPVYNASSILEDVLRSIEKQDYPISRFVCVDDCSTDGSGVFLKRFQKTFPFPVTIITHKKNYGWARSVNEVIPQVKTDLLITLSDDCIIQKTNGIRLLIEPFTNSTEVVESCSKLITSEETWMEYNFWLKCLFCRRVGKILSGRNSSFCCFSLAALKKIGLFDQMSFRTAGEDVDIMYRLEKIGLIVDANTIAEHVHSRDPNFSLSDLVYKQNQHAEAAGATLVRSFHFDIINLARIFFRPLIIATIFVPYARSYALLLIVLYSVIFTKKMYLAQCKNPRIFLLPFVNIFLLFSGSFYLIRGLLSQKQRL